MHRTSSSSAVTLPDHQLLLRLTTGHPRPSLPGEVCLPNAPRLFCQHAAGTKTPSALPGQPPERPI